MILGADEGIGDEDLITMATGGATRDILKKLETVEIALTISTVATLVAAALAAVQFLGRKGR